MLFLSLFGSGALPGKMLDLGLLKISWEGVFLAFPPVGGFNPARPYHNPFPKPAGQSLPLLNLTWPKININLNIFHNPLSNILPGSELDPKFIIQLIILAWDTRRLFYIIISHFLNYQSWFVSLDLINPITDWNSQKV